MSESSKTIPVEVSEASKYVDVLGAKIHYLEAGEGDPIVFLHGIPTSSYLWRNVMPFLSPHGRSIAPDLIGMGQSDKPDIEYTIHDHIKYITAFIEALELKNVTLVMHGWGSVIGFAYAMAHQANIKALAFMEAHVRLAMDWDMISLPVQELAQVMDAPDGGYDVIMNSNYYVNKTMPSGVLRTLSDAEMEHYRAPFKEPGSCKPIWQYLQELPLGDGSSPIRDLIATYSKALTESDLPKLMMYAVPGFNTTIDTVKWAKDNLKNLSLVDLGDALHYAQESNPAAMGEALKQWYEGLV